MGVHVFPILNPRSHLPPHPFPLGHPSAPAPSILYHASNLDWQFISHIIIYMCQCHSPISSPPRPLPQSPKDCSIHLFLFCCLAYRVIVTIFLQGELSLSIFRQGNLIALQMLQDSVIEDGNKEHIPEVTEDQSCIAQGPEVIVVFSFS